MSVSLEQNMTFLLQAGVDSSRRRLYLMGEVDAIMAYRFIVALQKIDETDGDITVVMNSGGGEETAGYAIYDAITMARNRVVIEGYGHVCSIAAAIFQAADYRKMAPNAQFMIHNGTMSTGDDVQQNIIMDLAEQVKKNNIRYHSILANRSKLSYSEVEDACERDTFYSAEECVKNGFCDEILTPQKKFPKRKSHKRKKDA